MALPTMYALTEYKGGGPTSQVYIDPDTVHSLDIRTHNEGGAPVQISRVHIWTNDGVRTVEIMESLHAAIQILSGVG